MGLHVMLDIETMGTGPRAPILSIGAVKFDEHKVVGEFHTGVILNSNDKYNREHNSDTILWWLHNDRQPAREAYEKLDKVSLFTALTQFYEFCIVQPEPYMLYDQLEGIWGNGATFDNVIIRSACEDADIKYPVPFWKDKCYRTVKNLRPDIELERVGTHHDALDDARNQAVHLQKIMQALGARL